MGSRGMILIIALALAAYLLWSLWSGRVIMRGNPLWTYRSKDPFSYWAGTAVPTVIILILLVA
jgi:hypothetical protein